MIPLNAKIQIFLPPQNTLTPVPIFITHLHTLNTLPSTATQHPSPSLLSSILLWRHGGLFSCSGRLGVWVGAAVVVAWLGCCVGLALAHNFLWRLSLARTVRCHR